ncbi:MAG TPA: Gmad2 immunoglobulin-like domain-containing protein [Segetibacter sp.]|jgi:hypothetical protein
MKQILIYLLVITIGCSSPDNNENQTVDSSVTTAQVENDSVVAKPIDTAKRVAVSDTLTGEKSSRSPLKVYANKRFKDVTVEKVGTNKFRVKGKGQIFEASFSWVVEDGHNEIKKGHEMTDAGAPEWGNFDFVVEVAKQRSNSTLHLIIFETSAKDGSRQYELHIKLE